MNNQTIMCCLVSLLLGMLLFHMLKGVCGCKLVEGQTNDCAGLRVTDQPTPPCYMCLEQAGYMGDKSEEDKSKFENCGGIVELGTPGGGINPNTGLPMVDLSVPVPPAMPNIPPIGQIVDISCSGVNMNTPLVNATDECIACIHTLGGSEGASMSIIDKFKNCGASMN